MKDTTFYNKESAYYSTKRYPRISATFTQFFFKERLRLTLALLAAPMSKGATSVLEIGCADGIVSYEVWNAYKTAISNFEAIDISPLMIDAAKKQYADTPIQFAVRTDVALLGSYGCIIEIGVLNYLDLEPELAAVQASLQSGGTYVCSLSGKSSLQTLLKGEGGFMHLETYAAYERALAKHFTIVQILPLGVFVPLLWKMPAFARLVQPLLERVVLAVAPNLAHEKIYVLTNKTN